MASSEPNMHEVSSTVFDEIAKKYETGTGGSTREIAEALLQRAPSITSHSIIHDNACGPAIITSLIYQSDTSPPPKVFATDYAQGMIDVTNTYKERHGWQNLEVQLMDGQDLRFENDKFTHSISCLGVFMFPDDNKGLTEMYRTLKPGGWIGVTSWNNIVWQPCAQEAYRRIFPEAKDDMVVPRAKKWEDPEDCEKNLLTAGFKDVKVEVIEVTNRQPDRETGIGSFLGFARQFSPTAKEWDDETFARFGEYFTEAISPYFVDAPDGSGVEMKAKAVLTYGTK